MFHFLEGQYVLFNFKNVQPKNYKLKIIMITIS